MNIPILYEDEVLLVINKPAGVVVNRAASVKEQTIQDWAIKNGKFPFGLAQGGQIANVKSADESTKDFIDRAGIVHRIDKETSGCLLIAKDPQAFIELQRQFKERVVKKVYLAIVHGQLVPQEGEIRAPVGRLPWNRERFGIVPGGKAAVTKYRVERSWFIVHGKNREEISLVELYPETGRTHQIRVHMKYIHHPLLGDYLYAGRKTARADRQSVLRVMLHAWKISFMHPSEPRRVDVVAPIPDDMNTIINKSTNDKSTNNL